ncbi:MAG: FAD:protein FMN transferase [Gemmatimonadetes bacterium]|nr:FAD:protein FMN transferase [Gemmatimonadota bacterium]
MATERESRGPSRRDALRLTAVVGVGLALGGGTAMSLVERARLHRVSVTRTKLGTAVNVTVVHPDPAGAHRMVEAAFAEFERLENIFSRYRAGTAVSRLNRDGAITDAPAELIEVMTTALDYAKLTEGAFDVTVAPVLNLYVSRFAHSDVPPSDDEVAAALALVGWDGVQVTSSAIALARPGMAVTMDGIAKGFVVDHAVAVLMREGAERVIVEAGGDMGAAGAEADPWKVAIQDPHDLRGSLGVLQLRGEALASSGDYMQYFTPDRRLNHIIDPRTGRSPEHTSGTTIRASAAMHADALSTSVFVLGPIEGIALLDRIDGVEGMLVTKTGEQVASKGFRAQMV